MQDEETPLPTGISLNGNTGKLPPVVVQQEQKQTPEDVHWIWNQLDSTAKVLEEKLTIWFELKERETTISLEVLTGVVQFVGCLYVLPVCSSQMRSAGYSKSASLTATALSISFGCIVASYFTNLPFVIAPPTSVSIFLSVSVQQSELSPQSGDLAVILSGIALLLIGVYKPLAQFIARLIPSSIQAGTQVGIGLITALAGAVELGLVVRGKYTILELGPLTAQLAIGLIAVVIIGVAMHFHFKGAFVLGLFFGSVVYWSWADQWPLAFASLPQFEFMQECSINWTLLGLVFNLTFLYILALNGLARSLSDLAEITNENGSIPRGSWLFIMCGAATVFSGLLGGPPILISPESAAGIKAGARTGLSTLIAGVLFGSSVFFTPFFAHVPAAGTSPLLLLVGMLLFQNVSRIKWKSTRESLSAFFVLLLIPFTYSVICGIGFGYAVYVVVGCFSGELIRDVRKFVVDYSPWQDASMFIGALPTEEDEAESVDGGGGRSESPILFSTKDGGADNENDRLSSSHTQEQHVSYESIYLDRSERRFSQDRVVLAYSGSTDSDSLGNNLPVLEREPRRKSSTMGRNSSPGRLNVGRRGSTGSIPSLPSSRSRSGSIIDSLQMDLEQTSIKSITHS